jgi:hypothetical protein
MEYTPEQRPTYTGRIILAFIIATLIFSGGFLLSYTISYTKYSSVAISQEEMRYALLGLELEKQIITSSCEIFDFQSISQELDRTGTIVGILEERFGKNDPRVLEQKKVYTMLEIQHFLLIKDYNEECIKEIPTILFFYSNEENYIESAEKMGYIISSLKTQNKEIMVYSFDFNLNSNLITLLKKKYNIENPNTAVINEENNIENINNINEVKPYIKIKVPNNVIRL